jgi:hypothetical protein
VSAVTLAAALGTTSAFARVEPRMINSEPPHSHHSEAVVERKGPQGEVLLKQEGDSDKVTEVAPGRLGPLPRPGQEVR